MAPEVLLEEDSSVYEPPADVFSFGILLWVISTGMYVDRDLSD
jgi:hypothetical protein